jgi:NACalpha-BTF3-like transcription factor
MFDIRLVAQQAAAEAAADALKSMKDDVVAGKYGLFVC